MRKSKLKPCAGCQWYTNIKVFGCKLFCNLQHRVFSVLTLLKPSTNYAIHLIITSYKLQHSDYVKLIDTTLRINKSDSSSREGANLTHSNYESLQGLKVDQCSVLFTCQVHVATDTMLHDLGSNRNYHFEFLKTFCLRSLQLDTYSVALQERVRGQLPAPKFLSCPRPLPFTWRQHIYRVSQYTHSTRDNLFFESLSLAYAVVLAYVQTFHRVRTIRTLISSPTWPGFCMSTTVKCDAKLL